MLASVFAIRSGKTLESIFFLIAFFVVLALFSCLKLIFPISIFKIGKGIETPGKFSQRRTVVFVAIFIGLTVSMVSAFLAHTFGW